MGDIPKANINCMDKKKIKKHLPLTESSAYILLALKEPLHGYGVMQKVSALSRETVNIGAGTLYTALATLEKQKLIAKAGQDGRRKLYVLTEFGQAVLAAHIHHTAILVENAQAVGIANTQIGVTTS